MANILNKELSPVSHINITKPYSKCGKKINKTTCNRNQNTIIFIFPRLHGLDGFLWITSRHLSLNNPTYCLTKSFFSSLTKFCNIAERVILLVNHASIPSYSFSISFNIKSLEQRIFKFMYST